MKHIFYAVVLSFFIFGCSYQNREDVDLAPTPVAPNRLQMQSMESVPLRKPEVDGSYTTTLSNYIDLARITSPELDNSFGDVQATAVDVRGNRAYVVYNTSGNEVGGAIDILDISDVSHPQILNTYLSKQFEFSSLVVKDNYLYAAGYQKEQGAILMILSVQGDSLNVVNVKKVSGVYATDISLFGNKLLVMTGESGGVTEFELGLGGSITEKDFVSASNGLSLSTNGYFDFYVDGSNQTKLNSRTAVSYAQVFPEIALRPSYVKEISQSKNKAPTRIKVKNSLLYSFDSVSNKLQVIDISQTGKTGQTSALSTIGQLSSMGTANGFDLDQQKAFLAMGEKGVGVGDLVNPKNPQMLGYLAFPSDNGSANNVWSRVSANNQKYLFIAYGRQGLRIIAEQPASGSDKKVVIYAKGDRDLTQNAKYQIKINGQVVKTQEVDEDYKQYVYTHTTTLSSNDVVEVIFINDNQKLNPLEKRNLFVNYLWVANKYCYQDIINTKGTLNNYGLFENGDEVAYNKGTCETKKSSTPTCSANQHLENNVCVDNERICFILNGTGTQTWSSVGGWGDCVATSCDSHCSLNNGSCIPNLCVPNSTASCSVTNGVGIKTCNSQGSAYGSCVPTTCNSGFNLVNGVCVPQVCTPNSTTSCPVTNGTGIKTCNSQGLAYGSCVTNSCNNGYTLINGVCTVQTCTPNSTRTCMTDDHFNGTQTCNITGSSWGSCVSVGSCCDNHYLSNGLCLPQVCTPNSTTSCAVTNGTGTKTCTSNGSGYNSCVPTTCNSGFTLINGVCTSQVCTPNSSTTCSMSNGTGSKTCNNLGTGYSSCSATACNSGYEKVVTPGNSLNFCSNEYENCVFKGTATVQYGKNGYTVEKQITDGTSCGNEVFGDPIIGIVKECLVKGTFSCQLRQCPSGQYDNGTSCVPQTCTPNATASCTINNFNGTKTCNSQGSAWGSCISNGTCVSGCSMSSNQCVEQICTPNSTRTCAVQNGIGSQTCVANGLSYGACTPTSCNSGYVLQNGQCVPQVCTPNSTTSCPITNGTGTKTCSSNGLAYGSCAPTGCNSGYLLQNGSCVPQVCTPNATTSCPITNGTGTQTCSANGMSVGSCSPTGCNAGYNLVNGQCVINPDYCTNGQTQSCSGNNGTGIKTCTNNSWNSCSCVINSCNSGYYLNNGTCVPTVCTPNSTASCTSNNFNGTKTCSSNGSSWGSCVTNGTCVNGYALSGGQCLPQVCTPNSTASCSVTNGTGTKTCASNGLSYGSCTPTSCNVGYLLQNGSCVINPDYCTTGQTQSCSISNGSGTKSCTNNSWSSSTCVGNSCNSGYYLNNGVCVPTVCTPNSTTSCTINNFNGTKTCNSQGSAYGSCISTGSCTNGYYLNNGTCVPQVCTPNTSASCSISNGTGSKMCNNEGSSYGSCNVISCNSGYSLVNGQCVSNSCSVSNGTGVLTQLPNNYQVNHNLTNDWITGYSYLLQIVNNSGSSLNDWSICFEYNYNVGNSGLWNAEMSCQYDQKPKWKLEPKSYNKVIYSGSNNTITWNAYPGNVGANRLTNIKLFNNSNASCESSTPIWTSSGNYCKATHCNNGYVLVNGACKKESDCD